MEGAKYSITTIKLKLNEFSPTNFIFQLATLYLCLLKLCSHFKVLAVNDDVDEY